MTENRFASKDLDQVLERFKTVPQETLLAEAIIYTSTDDTNETLRKAAAAAMGFSRSGHYLDAARSLLSQILADAAEISWRKESYDRYIPDVERMFAVQAGENLELARIKLGELISLQQGAKYLAVDAEILWHIYAVNLNRSCWFMLNSLRWISPGFQLADDDKAQVELVRLFRNHMEHRDKAITEISGEDWNSFTQEQRDGITLGYRRNAKNEVTFFPTGKDYHGREFRMPLNKKGFKSIETLIQKLSKEVERLSIEVLRKYFTDNPDELPDLDQIGSMVSDSLQPAVE